MASDGDEVVIGHLMWGERTVSPSVEARIRSIGGQRRASFPAQVMVNPHAPLYGGVPGVDTPLILFVPDTSPGSRMIHLTIDRRPAGGFGDPQAILDVRILGEQIVQPAPDAP